MHSSRLDRPSAAIAPDRPPGVLLDGVDAGYDGRRVLEQIDLVLEAGTLAAIVGPNGGGKSTLLKVIAGVLRPWSGRLEVLGAPAGLLAKRVAYVPQAESVDWSFPVCARDVAMMGRYPALGPLRRPDRADHEAVDRALEVVGMAEHGRRQIGELSGGQRRRVFLGRAIAADPDLYLLDEPVTGVDPTTQEDLMRVLEAEAARGKTIVATTHDLAAAAEHFGLVIALNRTIIAQGGPAEILDSDVLLRTYGGHLLFVGDRAVMLDDAHHHDDAAPGEIHHHENDTTGRPGGR